MPKNGLIDTLKRKSKMFKSRSSTDLGKTSPSPSIGSNTSIESLGIKASTLPAGGLNIWNYCNVIN